MPNYLLEGVVEYICSISSFILLDSFGTYVLGPVPGCRDIVVNKIGKNPCHHKAIYTSRRKQIIRECIVWVIKCAKEKTQEKRIKNGGNREIIILNKVTGEGSTRKVTCG